MTDPEALLARLALHVKTSRSDGPLTECLNEARLMVGELVGDRSVPEPIKDRALIECAADLYWRREARAGIATFDVDGGIDQVRIRRDPLDGARDILAPWLGVGIA